MARIAVVGAGWAGLACAVRAVQAGHSVHLFEASTTPGGRARGLDLQLPDGTSTRVDNGQHILIGAYQACLGLMRSVGVDPAHALDRRGLALCSPDGAGLRLSTALPAPLDAVWGVLRARGWSWAQRRSLLAHSLRWQRMGFACPPDWSVQRLCQDLHPQVRTHLIEPLCVSALNTPMAQASAQVFLRVLQDSLFGARGASHLLLPRTDLGALLPEAAVRWLRAHGAQVCLGQRVAQLESSPDGGWRLAGQHFDAAVLATCASNTALALENIADTAIKTIADQCRSWSTQARALRFEAIATVYTWAPAARALPKPMLALPCDAARPAQFVFDRSQLGAPAGLWAFVVSAASGERAALQDAVLAQAQAQLAPWIGARGLHAVQTVVEKRATFACTPALQRPPMAIAPGLWACGDYVQGPYPATLEGAVRSGEAVARACGAAQRTPGA
ncbi:MAG: hydroxysqualene dehydroxylase HpnE [Rhodoferax sp.]